MHRTVTKIWSTATIKEHVIIGLLNVVYSKKRTGELMEFNLKNSVKSKYYLVLNTFTLTHILKLGMTNE